LRYIYQRPEPEPLAISHTNLADYLTAAGQPGRDVLAHRLAAALFCQATGRTADYAAAVGALADDLRRYRDSAPPIDVDQLTAVVQQVDGVRFADMFTALVPNPDHRAALYTELLEAAHQAVGPIAQTLQQWAPIIAAVAAAAHGDQQAATELKPLLVDLAADPDWAALAATLRRIIGGDRDPATLTAGLDEIDIAIVTAVLDTPHQPDP
jgi:hypothetical protein